MTRSIRLGLILFTAVCLGASSLFAADAPEKPAKRKVVLIAGVKSHGPVGNGTHDYGWSVRLLHALLEQSNVKNQLHVEHHLDGWPKDPKAVEDADTIIVISDGKDGDKYSDALHLESKERVELVDRLMKRGCGMVLIHFSNFAPEKHADQVLRWVGGYFKWETNGERKWYSAIKTIEAEVKPLAADHPVLSGVKPFKMKEEFYYNLRFAADNGATVKLLGVADLKSEQPDGNVIAWARQRPAGEGGGRGFGTTCGHFYANWENDDFRRTVLNAIVWTAKGEVPKEGVQAKYIPRDELKNPEEKYMRLAFNALRILSLLLFVAAGFMWVRSYSINDRYSIATSDGEIDLGSARGGIYYVSKTNPADGSARINRQPGYHVTAIGPSTQVLFPASTSFAGFEYSYIGFFNILIWTLKIPYWALMTLFLVILAGPPLLRANRRRRRRRNGQCVACGYQLTGNVSGVCSECGAALSSAAPPIP